MKDLNIAAIQYDIAWEDPEENLAYLEDIIRSMNTPIDLIALPEMFSTGFTMNVKECSDDDNHCLHWMKEIAGETGIALYGSVIVQEDREYFNRGYFVEPSGRHHHYDKRHLFSMGEEHKHFSAGNKRKIIEYKGWKIFLSICYDLRFPVWSRNVENYDLLLNVACWPAVRKYAWQHLLQARGIENQAYILGLNRIGTDGNNLYYGGNSMLLDYRGRTIAERGDATGIIQASLNHDKLLKFRESHPFLIDKDSYVIEDEL